MIKMIRCNYKRFWVSVFILAITFNPTVANAFNIYMVGETISARSYVDVLKKWTNRDFSIWVGVNNGQKIIFFRGETGLKDASVNVYYGYGIQQKIEKIVSKSIEWSDIAKKNNADTSKGLGCLGYDRYEHCEEDGSAYKENQIGFRFFSANKGKQTDLVISIVDADNQFIKESLYLNLAAMKKLKKIIALIPKKFETAEKTDKNKELFQ